MRKLCFIDTETTGTDPNKNGLIQVSGIVDINSEPKESFDFHIQPFNEDIVEESALKVNRTTREDILKHQSPKEFYDRFNKILSSYVDKFNREDKFFFVGYNARFDADFIRSFFEKMGDKYFGSWFWFPPIDVMNLAMIFFMNERSEMQNFKLETIGEKLGIKIDGDLHDAMTDINLTRTIFNNLIKEIPDATINKEANR